MSPPLPNATAGAASASPALTLPCTKQIDGRNLQSSPTTATRGEHLVRLSAVPRPRAAPQATSPAPTPAPGSHPRPPATTAACAARARAHCAVTPQSPPVPRCRSTPAFFIPRTNTRKDIMVHASSLGLSVARLLQPESFPATTSRLMTVMCLSGRGVDTNLECTSKY